MVEPLPPLTNGDLARAEEEAVNQLITRHLILQAASRQNFVLDEAHVQNRVDLLFGTYGDETLDQALAQVGATRDDLFWWVREIFTVEEFTTGVVMAGAGPEDRQRVYNDWLDAQRAAANITPYLNRKTDHQFLRYNSFSGYDKILMLKSASICFDNIAGKRFCGCLFDH